MKNIDDRREGVFTHITNPNIQKKSWVLSKIHFALLPYGGNLAVPYWGSSRTY